MFMETLIECVSVTGMFHVSETLMSETVEHVNFVHVQTFSLWKDLHMTCVLLVMCCLIGTLQSFDLSFSQNYAFRVS